MQKRKTPLCFISYCRENADFESLGCFIQSLRQTSKNQIDFLFDEDLNPGDDLHEYMGRLTEVDAVLLVLTPEYKQRVLNRKGGVYTEYKEIIYRYELQLQEAINSTDSNEKLKPFCVIPIIFSGAHETACPDDLNRPISADFTKYRSVKSQNKFIIPNSVQNSHSTKISKIVSHIFAHYSENQDEVSRSFDDLLSSFFLNRKHEHLKDDPNFESELEHIFVKTHSFQKVKKQVSYLLVGRKGSGKSTIVDYISRDSNEKYKSPVSVCIDNFELDYLYNVLTPKQLLMEFHNAKTLNMVQFFEVVWELFVTISCLSVVLIEHSHGKLREDQLKHIGSMKLFFTAMSGKNNIDEKSIDYKSIYIWCYATVIENIEKAVPQSRNNAAEFHFDLSTSLNPNNLLRSSIPNELLSDLNSVLSRCAKRLLFSLDGFDTAFEYFRIRTQRDYKDETERRIRSDFEIDWLRGFLHVAINMKSAPRRTPLSNILDYCITIPKDRFIEIRETEKDSYLYIGKCYELRWSAIELVILLYKRLEVLSINFRSNKKDKPYKRLESVLKNSFSYIPTETTTTIDGVDYAMPIFIDVLRHTFWRPREILIYFAKIVSVLRDFKKRNLEITQFTIGKCISDTTRLVIKDEFISEFQRHCTNIVNILELFRKKKQTLSKDDLLDIIGGYGFEVVEKGRPIVDFDSQVSFLYEIGFIGLEASKQVVDRLKLLHQDIFWFNAGDEPFEVLSREGFTDCRFIIHPIFCEYLNLDVHSQRLVMKMDWSYLENQEAHIIVPS